VLGAADRMIRKSESVAITKKLCRSGGTLALSIPKDVIELLSLDPQSVVEVSLRKVIRVPMEVSPLVGR
jgi:hypothetical protein